MTRREAVVGVALVALLTGGWYALRAAATNVTVPTRADTVSVDARVHPDATAEVVVAPGSGDRKVVRAAGAEIAESLLDAPGHRLRERTKDGQTYVVVTLRDVYERDDDVDLHVLVGRMYQEAFERGWTRVELRVRIPDTHARSASWTAARPRGYRGIDWRMTITDTQQAGVGYVRLRPNVARAWLATALVGVAGAAAFAGISLWPRRRARGRTACGLGALACCLATPFLTTWPSELGVAGVASGPALGVLRLAVGVWLLALLAGPWLLLTPRRRATMRA